MAIHVSMAPHWWLESRILLALLWRCQPAAITRRSLWLVDQSRLGRSSTVLFLCAADYLR